MQDEKNMGVPGHGAGHGKSGCPPTPSAFGVLNHRSLQATAAYWNPILNYVPARSGVPLELHIGRTANETTGRVVAGQLDFAYTNHLFTPKRDRPGWRVLARQNSDGIRGQVVALDSSPVKSLQELAGKTVAFTNPYGFTGYYVPMDGLLRAGVEVTPLFCGSQEAAMGHLPSGEVAAAGVNHQVMAIRPASPAEVPGYWRNRNRISIWP